jgi:endonuclease/exonuclease/phosphatase family metal-dependent hydrolase
MDKKNSRNRIIWGSLVALTVVFGLQMIRVLLPLFGYFLRDTKGVSPMTLAPIAIGVFALSFLAAPLRRLVGLPTALAITAGGVAILRVVEQLSHDSAADLVLTAAGVALFTMFIPIALEIARPTAASGTTHFALALLVGLTADTAIHTAARTVDLSWQTGLPATIVVFVLAIVILDLLWLITKRDGLVAAAGNADGEWGWARILALATLGPWLFLQMVIFQNVARMAATSGWSLPVAGLIIGLGNVIGLIAAIHAPRSKRIPGVTILVALAFVFLLFFVNREGLLGVVASVAEIVLAASLIATLFIALGYTAEENGRMGAPAANGIGQLLFVIMTFLFYVSYDMSLGFRAPAILVAAAVLFALGAILVTRGLAGGEEPEADYKPALVAAALLLLPLVVLQTWDTPEAISPPADNRTVRVMDYNLHNGFNTDGQLNMEELAQVMEAADADVIALQEVSRGWLLNGSVDMLEWLSQRLDLPYVYGPTEGLLWGNAILSRYPVVSEVAYPLPPDSSRLHRGYLIAEIDIGQERIQIMDTHLHHIEADSEIRQEQVPVLIEGWDGAPRSILMGDLNATPDSPEMMMLAAAGLVNVTAEIGPDPSFTYYSANPDNQIDYIWISPDLIPLESHIPQSTASDHLPIIGVITVP